MAGANDGLSLLPTTEVVRERVSTSITKLFCDAIDLSQTCGRSRKDAACHDELLEDNMIEGEVGCVRSLLELQ